MKERNFFVSIAGVMFLICILALLVTGSQDIYFSSQGFGRGTIDTNAETACAVGEVLYGDGTCNVPVGDINGLTWNALNSVVPWADVNVANDITLTNLTQIVTRSYNDLQDLPVIPIDTNYATEGFSFADYLLIANLPHIPTETDIDGNIDAFTYGSSDFNNIYLNTASTTTDLNNPHMYGLSTDIGVTEATEVSQWQTIDFNAEISDVQFLTFEDSNTVIISEDGHYTIVFGAGFEDSAANPTSMVGMRIIVNGVEIRGSYVVEDLYKKDADVWLEHLTHTDLNTGDKVVMQWITDKTTVRLIQDDLNADQSFNAMGFIEKSIDTGVKGADGTDGADVNIGNAVIIAKSGGDYDTIQAALNANSAGGELFLVYHGVYTDDTINFTANNQEVRGMGVSPNSVKVSTVDSNIVDFGAFTGLRINRIKMEVTGATSLVHTVQGNGGSLNLVKCHTSMTTTYNANGVQPSCIHTKMDSKMKVVEGTIEYNHTGSNALVAKAPITWKDNDGEITVRRAAINITNSGNAFVTGVSFGTGTSTLKIDRTVGEIIDPNASIIAGFYIGAATAGVGGSPQDGEFTYNTLHITGGGALATGVFVNVAGADIRGMYNHLHVEGSTTNNSYFIANVDSNVTSQFEDLIASDGINNVGIAKLTYINSGEDGNFSVSDSLITNKVCLGTNCEMSIDYNGTATVIG